MERATILGIPVDAVSQAEARDLLLKWLNENGQHHVMTVNNEMLVESTKNPEFRKVLQSTSMNVPDSTGVVLAAKFTGQSMKGRVPGVDLVRSLCETLEPITKVFLLGAADGVAERAMQELKKTNSSLDIVCAMSGSPLDQHAEEMIKIINEHAPHFLLVAFGAPKQDLWIAKHLKELPSVRVAMGVGGTFDFLAGTVKRAPAWMRSIGLEWLWRLIRQPSRLGRIVNAVVVFPLLVLRYGRSVRV